MSDKDFFDVPLNTIKLSTGEADFPILYYDSSAVFSFFWASIEDIEPKLAGTGLFPFELAFGKTVIGLAFFEYRDTSIGRYNEIAIAIPAYPEHLPKPAFLPLQFFKATENRDFGFYILDLPVTTQIAFAAGTEVWGYPKFVTGIPFNLDLDEGKFISGVKDPSGKKDIFTIEGDIGLSIPSPFIDLVLYSNLDNKLIKTVVDVKTIMNIHFTNSLRVNVGSSSHIMAQNLKDLGFDGASPFLVLSSNNYQIRLNEGSEIG